MKAVTVTFVGTPQPDHAAAQSINDDRVEVVGMLITGSATEVALLVDAADYREAHRLARIATARLAPMLGLDTVRDVYVTNPALVF